MNWLSKMLQEATMHLRRLHGLMKRLRDEVAKTRTGKVHGNQQVLQTMPASSILMHAEISNERHRVAVLDASASTDALAQTAGAHGARAR